MDSNAIEINLNEMLETTEDLPDMDYVIKPIDGQLLSLLPSITLGQRIDWIRLSRGIYKKNGLAILVGISKSTYYYIIRRNDPPEANRLLAIARALEVDPVLLITGKTFQEVAAIASDAELMKILRCRRGWTQAQFAEALVKAGFIFHSKSEKGPEDLRPTIHYWEKGTIPHKNQWDIIRKVLGYEGLFKQKYQGVSQANQTETVQLDFNSAQAEFIIAHLEATNAILAFVMSLWPQQENKTFAIQDIARFREKNKMPPGKAPKKELSEQDLQTITDFLDTIPDQDYRDSVRDVINKSFKSWQVYIKNLLGFYERVELHLRDHLNQAFDTLAQRRTENDSIIWGISVRTAFEDYDFYPISQYPDKIFLSRPNSCS